MNSLMHENSNCQWEGYSDGIDWGPHLLVHLLPAATSTLLYVAAIQGCIACALCQVCFAFL